MPILALATSGPAPEVALRLADGSVVVQPVEPGRGRGRDVMPRIQDLLASRDLAPSELTAVAVDVGPGSFTGVRVGVTTAKALAYALRVSVLPVDSLALLAAAADTDDAVLSVRDAGRDTFYFSLHGPRAESSDGAGPGAGRLRAPLAQPARGGPAALQAVRGDAVLIGEGIAALAERIGLDGPVLETGADARTLLGLALEALEAGASAPAHDLAPLYLQASAPERLRAGERG